MDKPSSSSRRQTASALARQCADPPGLLAGQRVRPVLILAGVVMGLSSLFRLGLLIGHWAALEGAGWREILRCLLIGLRYDAVPAGYALVPMIVVLMAASDDVFRRTWFRRAVTAYAATIATVVVLFEGVGAFFFIQFAERINYIAMEYIFEFAEPWIFIITQYPVWLGVATLALLAYLSYRLFRRAFWAGLRPRGARVGRAVLTPVMVLLAAFAARGSVRSQPLRQGCAYFSANNIVVQLSLNNIYTFARAMSARINDYRDEESLYEFPVLDKASQTVTQMLTQSDDTPIPTAGNPLWRKTNTQTTQRNWNVVLIVMEGMAGKPVGALGHSPSYTPNFDRLCQDGLFFERMYAVGARTSRGVVGVLCGHPDLAGRSVLKQPRAQGKFLTLPAMFRSRGYRSMFIYGGDSRFDNMAGFLKSDGVDEVIDQCHMGVDPEQIGNWGVPDEVTFQKAHETFQAMGDSSFFAVMLTVSNHEPYQVPQGRAELLPPTSDRNRRLNGYIYADWALGEFFRQARQAPYFHRTVFVLVSDHGRNFDHRRILDVPGYRVPCLIYAPGLSEPVTPGKVSTVCSQADIAPTVLGLMGGAYEHCFLGRNVMKVAADDGFAFLHEDDRLALVRADKTMLMPPAARPLLFPTDPTEMKQVDDCCKVRAGAMEHEALSYYLMARRLYLTGQYRRPDTAGDGN